MKKLINLFFAVFFLSSPVFADMECEILVDQVSEYYDPYKIEHQRKYMLNQCQKYLNKSCKNAEDCGAFPCIQGSCLVKPCHHDSDCLGALCASAPKPAPVTGFCTRGNHKEELDGTIHLYYSNGSLRQVINYKNGVLDGLNEQYYADGKIQLRENYVNDKKNGVMQVYYENGNLKHEQESQNGERQGVSRYYYENGNLEREMYFQNGKEVKKFSNFAPDGHVISETDIDENGNGFHREYQEDGKIKMEINYQNGKAILTGMKESQE